MKFRRIVANRGGFSLIEIIFSIAILAITSLFVIQIFLKAVNLEHKAKSYDHSLAEMQAAVETFKIYRTLNPELLPDGMYETGAYSEADGTFKLTLGFDKSFSPIDISVVDVNAIESSAIYIITVYGGAEDDGMRELKLEAFRTTGFYLEPDEPQSLFSLTTEVFAGSGVTA